MAHKENDDMLMEDELAAAFLAEDNTTIIEQEAKANLETVADPIPTEQENDDTWAEETDDLPGQLAVDVYETTNKLVVKARTAGISKTDLNVTIADNILTISGVLSGGEDDHTTCWHIQECYWGEFSRTIALPVQVKEEGVKAELKDGVLTISFEKEQVESPKQIQIQ